MNIERLKRFAASDGDDPVYADILELIRAHEYCDKAYAEKEALLRADYDAEITRRDEMIACSNKLIADYREIERTREAHVADMDCTCHLDSNGTRKCAVHNSVDINNDIII